MNDNVQIFIRYVNEGDVALEGLSVQTRARFQELRKVYERFFVESPEMQLELDVPFVDIQKELLVDCVSAIEQLDVCGLRNALTKRRNYDAYLHMRADKEFNSLFSDQLGNKYDEKMGDETRLERVFSKYSAELHGCNELLIRTVWVFCFQGAAEIVYGFPPVQCLQTSESDLEKMMLLGRLFVLHRLFQSLKSQLAVNVILARMKNNSDSVIARTLETDTKKLQRMVNQYEVSVASCERRGPDILVITAPMRSAQAQEKLFSEKKGKPEYAFVGYVLSHQCDGVIYDFQADLMEEFMRSARYCAFALAVQHGNEDPDKPVNAYLFKLRIMNVFLRQYNNLIAPTYSRLKKLGVSDELIQCVLYEGRKEFRKRVA